MNTLNLRLLKSSGANGLSLIARLSEQIFLVPILLTTWSADRYGEWMMLSALPTYLALSDMGFITAGSNELARRASQEGEESVRGFYGRYLALCIIWGFIFWIAICTLTQFFSPATVLDLHKISPHEANTAFLILASGSLLSQNSLALLAGLRVRARYHQGLLIRAGCAFGRLILIALFVIYADAGPIGVASISTTGYLFGYLIEAALVNRTGLRPIWKTLLRGGDPISPYILMGLEYMLMPFATMLVLQGMVILVGTALGAVSVTIFTTHRTLTRLISSLLQIISNPLRAEVGLLQKDEDLPMLRDIMLKVSNITMWISLTVMTILIIIGHWIFSAWTRGEVVFHPVLFFLLILATLGETIWRTLSAPRLGSNRHRPLVWGYFALSIIGLILARLSVKSLGLEGVGIAAAAIDIGMSLFVAIMTLPLLGISWSTYLKSLARPPLSEINRLICMIIRR